MEHTDAEKREVDILILSDIHLGTIGCKAKELFLYLNSISPKYIILNGDIIDIWQFRKSYFPNSHLRIIKYFTEMMAAKVPIKYISGNHDELLRKFNGTRLGSLTISNKLVLQINGEKLWLFHGDVFDVVMNYSKWLAKLGSKGYDLLIVINSIVNYFSVRFGKGRISLSKKIKSKVKTAVSYINSFEKTAIDIALYKGFDYVVCGHIHQPQITTIEKGNRKVTYMNSGDWVENMSALEYTNKEWKIYRFSENVNEELTIPDSVLDLSAQSLFQEMLSEMRFMETPTEAKVSNLF